MRKGQGLNDPEEHHNEYDVDKKYTEKPKKPVSNALGKT